MAERKKEVHPNFLKYMEMIVNHPNYKGLPFNRAKDGSITWVATAKSNIGEERIAWCDAKAKELGIPIGPGTYAKVMLAIHPTKKKPCQVCGKEMWLYYLYPNAKFADSIFNAFGKRYPTTTSIDEIWDDLIESGQNQITIGTFFAKSCGLPLQSSYKKVDLIKSMEQACRIGDKKCLGPGAMSNFPDRYDGFHSYNRCCRGVQDKGRSKENLKSYGKDRRAYENWSDGNIHAADLFMHSEFFANTSADHVGPLSLGFVHDPRYLQPMPSNKNSEKRDRLQYEDIEKIIEIQDRTNVYPMSWYSREIWEYIKSNYRKNKDKIGTSYRDALKQNMANYMYILQYIVDACGDDGVLFLIGAILQQNFDSFNYDYEFNRNGDIISQHQRHFTDRNRNEIDRYIRIAFESVRDYNSKSNRNIDVDLEKTEVEKLKKLCRDIGLKIQTTEENKVTLEELVSEIQKRIISNIL